jgi:hypothetical protein
MARMKPTVWIGIAFAVVFLAAVALSTFRSQPYRVHLCITYNGATDCRSASAQTKEDAQRTAATAACAHLAGGVSDSIRCENTPPSSIEWK